MPVTVPADSYGPPAVVLRRTSYPATASSGSVDASHAISMLVGEAATTWTFCGTVGAVVSLLGVIVARPGRFVPGLPPGT